MARLRHDSLRAELECRLTDSLVGVIRYPESSISAPTSPGCAAVRAKRASAGGRYAKVPKVGFEPARA